MEYNAFWVFGPSRSMDKSKIELNPLLPVIIREELVDHYVFTYDIVFFLSASSLLYTLFEMKLRA